MSGFDRTKEHSEHFGAPTEPSAEDRVREAREAYDGVHDVAMTAMQGGGSDQLIDSLLDATDTAFEQVRSAIRESTEARYAALVEAAGPFLQTSFPTTQHRSTLRAVLRDIRALTASAPSEETVNDAGT